MDECKFCGFTQTTEEWMEMVGLFDHRKADSDPEQFVECPMCQKILHIDYDLINKELDFLSIRSDLINKELDFLKQNKVVMSKKQYINFLVSFYGDQKENLSNDYLNHKIYKDMGIPFEMFVFERFVFCVCETKHTQNVYDWFSNHYKQLKNECIYKDRKKDLFEYMIEKYSEKGFS